MLTHIIVAQPWLVRESDHRVFSRLTNLHELDTTGAQELLTTISHITCHIVDDLPLKHAIFEAYVEIELSLRDYMLVVSCLLGS